MAGTTRDTVEEILNIEGVLFRLIDTAGIREHTDDQIESQGMAKSLEKMRSANLVVYLFDVNQMDVDTLSKVAAGFEQENIAYLLVGNKADLAENNPAEKFNAFPALQGEATVITNARHHDALQKLAAALQDVQQGLDDQITSDLLALDIRQCLHYLGTITGQITNEDQLDFIFSKFCIGK